ncbi:MAG: cell envelope integrity protein TolA [Thermodesulfobacteriota bacterium]
MNERVTGRNGFSDAYATHRGPVFVAMVISLAMHILVFVLLTLLPDLSFRRRPPVPSVLNVTMVSMATPGSGPKAGPIAPDSGGKKDGQATMAEPPKPKPEPSKPEPPKPEPPRAAPVKIPEPPKPEPKPEPAKQPAKQEVKPAPEAVSLAPKPENQKPPEVQKPQPPPAPSLKETLAKLEKKVAQQPPDSLKSTLDRLRATVGKEEAAMPKTGGGIGNGIAGGSGAASNQGGQGGDSTTGMPGLGLQAMQAIDFYRSLIGMTIEKNWFFSENLTGGRKDLVTVLVIKILPNGQIADIWYERKSGNVNFDDAAFKAVKKSNPLPPLPKEYTRPYYEVGLVFTPAGLNKG